MAVVTKAASVQRDERSDGTTGIVRDAVAALAIVICLLLLWCYIKWDSKKG